VLVALAACRADPTLHVDVTHPAGLAVASTTISVYESAQFGCTDVEYGDVDDLQLQAALVASETVATGGATAGALANLSRTDKKIVVARGYDASGANVAAGCAEKTLVSGNDELAIATEVTATVSVGLADPTGADFYGIAVTTTDPTGALLDRRQVWWRVFGPSGATPATTGGVTTISDGVWQPAQPTCSNRGVGIVHPVPPLLVGGFAIAVRVAWASAPPPLFSAFTKADFSLAALAPPNSSTRFCATQIAAGAASLACLDTDVGVPIARQLVATVAGGAATLSTLATDNTIPPDAMAVYAVPNGADQNVFVMTSHCAVAGVLGSTPADPSQACAAGGGDDVLYVPACGSVPARALVHVSGGPRDTIVQVAPAGGALAPLDFPLAYRTNEVGAALVGAGCVSELDPAGGPPTVRQVVVVTYTRLGGANPSTRAQFACGTSCTEIELPVPEGGVGFIAGAEPRMIVANVDATGVVADQVVLVPLGAGEQLVERARVPSAGVPATIAVGRFDADDALEMLWDVRGGRGTTFELAYDRVVAGQPLEALSQTQPIVIDSISVSDLTGDGFDDIAFTGNDATGKKGVAVIPTRVPAATVPMKTDSTCAP
jgi:hypothetical protein